MTDCKKLQKKVTVKVKQNVDMENIVQHVKIFGKCQMHNFSCICSFRTNYITEMSSEKY